MDLKKTISETLTIKFDKAFGLDISDRSVEMVVMEKLFRFSVVTYGRIDLPNKIIQEGRIIDPDALALKIKTLLKEVKPRKVSTNKVVISLPENQTFIKTFQIDSTLRGGQLEKEILNKLSTSTPLGLDKMFWDYKIQELSDKTKKLVMFVGVPKEIALSYVKLCNSIGLEVVSISTEAFSLSRVILKKSEKQSLIIDLGADVTNLIIFDSNEKINLAISLPFGGEDLTGKVSVELKLEWVEAEALKIKNGFKDKTEITSLMLTALQPLIKDIQTTIDYYETNFKQKLDEIYITGGSSLLPNITDILKKNLNREVRLVTGGNNINLNFLANQTKNFPLFTNVIGLGMLGASAQFKDLNLLKQIPHAEINDVDRLNLFKLGYLSRVNTVRMIFNNKYVLITLIILIGVIFAILIQQAQTFGLASASSAIIGTY